MVAHGLSAKKRHCQLFVQSFCFVFANCHMTMVCISLYTAITGCGTALLCRGCSEYLVRTEYFQLRTSRKGSTKPRRVAYLQRHVHVSAPMHAEHAKSKLAQHALDTPNEARGCLIKSCITLHTCDRKASSVLAHYCLQALSLLP